MIMDLIDIEDLERITVRKHQELSDDKKTRDEPLLCGRFPPETEVRGTAFGAMQTINIKSEKERQNLEMNSELEMLRLNMLNI